MATWQDGPEYAPLVRPAAFEPPEQPPVGPAAAAAPEDDPERTRSAQARSAQAPHVRPGFTAPDSVPLDALSSDSPQRRDPHEPFSVVVRPTGSGSAWPAAHAAVPQPWPAPSPTPPPDGPGSYGSVVPYPPAAPSPEPGPYPPPVPYAPPADGSDLDARERSALWLLLPGALYLLGAWTGALMTLAMLLAALLLAGRSGVRPAARTLSRIVLVGLSAVALLAMLNGEGLGGVTAVARGVGLVYAFLCAMWFVRERSAIDVERHRRSEQTTIWPPPQDRG